MQFHSLDVHTDGSEKDDAAGFAIAIVGHGFLLGEWGSTFLGAFGGEVCTDMNSPDCIGAQRRSATEAELSAMVWAALWLVGNRNWIGNAEVRFRFDALLAGRSSEGAWTYHDSDFADHVRKMMQLCESVVGRERLNWWHVKAHAGQPFNELVDVLADCFRRERPIKGPCHPRCARATPGKVDLTWANLFPALSPTVPSRVRDCGVSQNC